MGVGDEAGDRPDKGEPSDEDSRQRRQAVTTLPPDLPRLQADRVREMERLMRGAAAFARGESSQ
ncbi:hypothetical protein [Niveispirillum irakense]|uniref:hypothetical protein n=1 Tax=Niveispirillum irakense TaxID=34011 RepID=UPI000405F437|nr:hypothetical protein [Niveispirillum irakense]